MAIQKVHAVYLSPTGTTARAVIAAGMGAGLSCDITDLTSFKKRQGFKKIFSKDELVIAGLPVYAGRLPTHLDDFFAGLEGNGAPAAALVMYGHRDYDDALLEMKNRLEERGFNVIAAAAFVGEHTFSKNIAPGRPDDKDLALAAEFGAKALTAANNGNTGELKFKGNFPYKMPGFDPENPGPHAHFPLIVTGEGCTRCGTCADECPWGAIAMDDNVTTDNSKCMHCFHCIRVCPTGAKKAEGDEFFKNIGEFEKRLNAEPKNPELFFAGE